MGESFLFKPKEMKSGQLWGELWNRDVEGKWHRVETGPYEKFVKFIPYLKPGKLKR